MNTKPYVWARAFSTVFIPEFVNVNGRMKWDIFHYINGWHVIRESRVPTKMWYEVEMWRSDGVLSSRPTFSLVLYNHKCQTSL